MQSRSARAECLLLVFSVLALSAPGVAFAEDPDEEVHEEIQDGPIEGVGATGEVFSPPGVTGEWDGARSRLAKQGVGLSLDFTQSVQGVMNGGFDEETEYLGSIEMILDLDTEKLGLWEGGFARMAAEARFGNDVLADAGAFSPVYNDALFPSDPDREGDSLVALTELTATQFLAPWIGLYGGLLNTTSGDANDYAGFARSNEHFQNLSLLLSPVSLRIVPSVTLGGGFVVIPFEWLIGTFTVMDTEESAGSNPFNTDDGLTFVTEWEIEHQVLDAPVRHVAAFGLGFDNDFFKLGDLPRLELPPGAPPELVFDTEDESWALWYNGQVDLWSHPEDEERKAGVFARFGYADDETNFVEWNLAFGFGGVGVFDVRPRDRFGIGLYHIEPSDGFPLPQFGVQEETGVEVFYNAELVHGINLTADLQYIDTGFGNGSLVTEVPSDAWIGGFRLRIVF
jgi:porin